MNKQNSILSGLVPILACTLFFLSACDSNIENGKPLIVTSIAPLGDWITEIGGDDIDVLVLVPPASSPHTFELSPGQLREASRASLVVLNGAGLEYWADKLLENLRDPNTPVVTLSDDVDLLQDGSGSNHAAHNSDSDLDEHSAHHDHSAGNPHFWLDPVIAASALTRIGDAVSALLPDRADSIRARVLAFQTALALLDLEITEVVKSWRKHRFIGDHSSWIYFARRYGLEEVGVIEAIPGREVSAREMAALIGLVRNTGADVVFADSRKSPRAAEIIAEETGARIARLDPMGSQGTGYVDLLRSNVKEMSRVMR